MVKFVQATFVLVTFAHNIMNISAVTYPIWPNFLDWIFGIEILFRPKGLEKVGYWDTLEQIPTAMMTFVQATFVSKGNFITGPHGLLLNHWTKTSPMWTITRPGVDEKLLNFISIISSKIQVYYLKKCCEIFFSYSNVKPHFLQDLLKQISSLVQNVSSLD